MDATTSFPAASPLRLPIAGLGRSRLAIGTAGLAAIAVATAWQWGWLVAIGVAPVLLSVAPCAAMCGLGLCLRRIGSRSCGSANSQTLAVQADPEPIENLTIAQSNQGDPT